MEQGRHASSFIPLEDDDQPLLKQIVATNTGNKCRFALRKTQEDGTFTVTGEATKVEVSKTIQGFVGGAWILDTLERTVKIASQAELAEQELTACCKRAINTSQEDLENGRVGGPMFVSGGKAHFSYFQEVKGSCPQEMAVDYHVGMAGLSIATAAS